MGRRIKKGQAGSSCIGELPLGCRLCGRGSKMVLFVTGLCDSSCYYCPLSLEKTGKDVTFADEVPVTNDEDVLHEVEVIGAEGSGFSGGDPLCQLDRTVHYISLLKSARGNDFHIHLYTSRTDLSARVLRRLKEAGLDEIRFHPQTQDWTGIARAVRTGMQVGLEVPVIPGSSQQLKALAERAERTGARFLNLNELEASETNFQRLAVLGMRLTSMAGSSIMGSEDTALEVMAWATENLGQLSVHYCTASFKDGVQLRNRLYRRLKHTRRPFEEKDDTDPLLILGVIRGPHGHRLDVPTLESIRQTLKSEFDVPPRLMNLDQSRMRIEIAPWILQEIAHGLGRKFRGTYKVEMGIAREYPSWDRLQTLFEPL